MAKAGCQASTYVQRELRGALTPNNSLGQENQPNLPGGNHTHSMWRPHSWPETPNVALVAGF